MPPISPARVIIELLRAGQSVQFRARGSSMWPLIPSGSQVELTPCAPGELKAGELGAFERGGQVVVHRVQDSGPGGVLFAGDSRAADDGYVRPEQVLGRARVLARRRLRVRLPSLWHLRAFWRALVRSRRAARAAK